MATLASPPPPQVILENIQKLLAAGNLPEAQKLVDEGLVLFPDNFRFHIIAARLAETAKDMPRAIEILANAIATAKKPRPAPFAQLARILHAERRIDDAFRVLNDAFEKCGDQPLILAEAMKLAALRGEPDQAIEFGDRFIARVDKDTPRGSASVTALAYLKRDYMDTDAALAIVERGLQIWPDQLSLLFARATILGGAGMRASARSILETRVLPHPDLQPEQKKRAVEHLVLLNGTGYIDGDENVVVPDQTSLATGDLVDDMNSDSAAGIFIHRAPASDKALLVFTGLAHEAGGIPLQLLHGLLSDLQVNVIYLRDFQRLLYCNGVQGLEESYASTLSAIRTLQEQWGATRLYCLGMSGGGYGAIRYGIDLNAEAILGFGAATTIDKDLRQFDARGPSVIYQIEKHVPEMLINLRTLLEDHPSPPKIHLYYGDEMKEDHGHATNLDGIPGTTLIPEAGFGNHHIAGKLLAEGRLANIIRHAIGE